MSMKNSNDTIGNRTRDLPACSVVPQPTVSPRAPLKPAIKLNLEPITCRYILYTYMHATKHTRTSANYIILPSFRHNPEAVMCLPSLVHNPEPLTSSSHYLGHHPGPVTLTSQIPDKILSQSHPFPILWT
jgi:hypothetical protein